MKIGIISLGLIGGSLFKRLTGENYDVYAVTRNIETLKKTLKYSEHVSDDIKTLKDCDVVFVASPISEVMNMLDKLESVVSKNCIVLDCASVKEFVMKKQRPYIFIGSHPMAGTEFSGFDASFEELFEGAKWVLTPSDNTADESVNIVKEILESTGAEIIIADAEEHDKAAALISHMPLLISQALFHAASDNELALKLASSGFRDMTRLAMSNLTMAEDMRNFNSKNINYALEKLTKSAEFLKNTKVSDIFSDIKNARSNMYSKEGKNIIR